MKKIAYNAEKLKCVILRTDTAGCHIGFLKSCTPTNDHYDCELINTRRIWEWDGAFSLSDLAWQGSKNHSGCKFSITLPENRMMAIEIISVTEDALVDIDKIPVWLK